MKLLSKIIICFTFLSIPIYSQENINKSPENDSTKTFKMDALFNLAYKFNEFEFYRNLTKPMLNFNVDSTTAKLWLKTSVEMSNNSSFNNENNFTPVYLHSILYDEYLEKSKFNPVRTVLGMIQAGAVGYLAYRHIKKWGFIK